MSFILDALKKSETDRQQDASPGIAAIPVSSGSPGTPRWVALLGLLLAVNVVLIAVLIFRPDSAPAPSTPSGLADAQPAAPVADARQSRTQPATDRPRAAEPVVPPAARVADPEPDAATERVAPAVTQNAAQESPPTQTPAARPAVSVEAAVASAPIDVGQNSAPVYEEPDDVEDTYLTFNELRASGAFNLPDMHVDLHVYSDNPDDRLVFINMNQYRENATLDTGPRLRRITPEGVILEYQGTRFLLPRE